MARKRVEEAEEKVVRGLTEKKATEDDLALPALWELTNSRLNLYHQIATTQARSSFLTAQVAAGLGFVWLSIFAYLATRAQTPAGAITTGSLGAVSAALAGYIGRTFVRSQESAAGHLRSYFDQPMEFSRYLAAERIFINAKDLDPHQRAVILTAVVEAMVAPEASTSNAENGHT